MKARILSHVLTLATMVFLTASAHGQQKFVASLSSAQVVPPNSSTARATCRVTALQFGLGMDCEYSGLSSGLTDIHIHNAPVGRNASGPLYDFSPPTGATSGTFSDGGFWPGSMAGMLNSKAMYIDIHTATHPEGELRGQIKVVSNDADFDGDGRTDVSVFRSSDHTWYMMRSIDGVYSTVDFGTSTDKLEPADYTGDGLTDIAFFRPSTGQWFVLRSEDRSYYAFQFGADGDIPAPGDYDADGKADSAVFRPSEGVWYILRSTDSGVTFAQFGLPGDRPVAADYDADGKTDIAVYRANGATGGEWWIQRSSAGVTAVALGEAADKPVPADYSGDGTADIALYRPSEGLWIIERSEGPVGFTMQWGLPDDIPAAADFDGDGRIDAAVYRSGVWYINRYLAGNPIYKYFGTATDVPVPGAFMR